MTLSYSNLTSHTTPIKKNGSLGRPNVSRRILSYRQVHFRKDFLSISTRPLFGKGRTGMTNRNGFLSCQITIWRKSTMPFNTSTVSHTSSYTIDLLNSFFSRPTSTSRTRFPIDISVAQLRTDSEIPRKGVAFWERFLRPSHYVTTCHANLEIPTTVTCHGFIPTPAVVRRHIGHMVLSPLSLISGITPESQ